MVLSRRSIDRLDGVKAILIMIVAEAIKDSPYDFGIAWMGGLRTNYEQHELFLDGKSKLDGYNKISKHQTGLAFDIVCYGDDNKITWSPFVFEQVAEHIMDVAFDKFNVELEWGGDWKKFKDRPHFQIN